MPRKRAVGAVFPNELQAGEAVRALHHWNRAQRPRPLGSLCVVTRRRSGRVRYQPYRVPRARTGAARGLLYGLLAGAILGLGAGLAMGAPLDSTVSTVRGALQWLAGLPGRGAGFDVDQAAAAARSGPFAGALALAVGFGMVGAIAGAAVGALMGWLGHGMRGFHHALRATVAQPLRPSTGAIVAWVRGEPDEALLGELRRLGGEPRRDLQPAVAAATPAVKPGKRSA